MVVTIMGDKGGLTYNDAPVIIHAVSQPKKHVRTLHDRLKIIEEVERSPGEKRVNIAKRLGLSASTLNSIVAKKDEIRVQAERCGEACKKRKTSKESSFTLLENVLFTWYQQARESNTPINGTILKEEAKLIAAQLNINNFTASNGWISRFKDRHGLVFKKHAVKNNEVKHSNSWSENLFENYEPRDIYSAAETGLFFNVLPDKIPIYKDETCHDGRLSKDRLTLLLCVNSDGSEKQMPIVIGKYLKPKCFGGVKKLPTEYHANDRAWMTTDIFCSFLHSLDAQMGAQNRQIILFVDNSAVHPEDTSSFRNVKVVHYPTDGALRPLHLGIVHSLKSHYRKYAIQSSGEEMKKRINTLEAIHYIMAAWQRVSQKTIQNCFRKAGHKYHPDDDEIENNEDDDDDDDDDFNQNWEELCRSRDYDFQSYISIDDQVVTCGDENNEYESYEFSRSVKEETDEDESDNDDDAVPNSAEAYEALQKIKSFFFTHSENDVDYEHILNLEKSYFQMRQNPAKRKRTINNYFY